MVNLPNVLQSCLVTKYYRLNEGLKVVGHATPAVFNAWPVVVGEGVGVGGWMALIPGGGFTHVANASASCSTSFLLEAVSSVTVVVRARIGAVCWSSMSDFATAAHARASKDPLIF